MRGPPAHCRGFPMPLDKDELASLLLLLLLAFLSSYHEKATKRLGVAGHLSTTLRWGNPVKCLFQRHNKKTCRLVLHTVP